MKKKIGPKKVLKTASDAKPKKKKQENVKEFRVKDVLRTRKPLHVEKTDQRGSSALKNQKRQDDLKERPNIPAKKAKTKKQVAALLETPRKKKETIDIEAVIVEPKKGSKKADKKMAKMTAQLAVLGDVSPKAVKQTLTDNFGAAAPKIIDMLEMNDNDGAMILLQKRLLQSSIAMLTYAEQLMRDTQGAKGTYQYATLVSQIRELITDIQANRDRSFIANSIIDQNIRPAFIDMAETILNDHQAFRKEVQESGIVKVDKFPDFNNALRDMAKQLAMKMSNKYKDLSHNITVQLTS